jgi:hypothetical protein
VNSRGKPVTINQETTINQQNSELSEYVAHLQLHMALQARNLVPALSNGRHIADSRSQLLHQTQAEFEKLVSRL